MTKQDQRVGENAEAYQAGNNLVVNNGLSTEQVSEIMIQLGTQLGAYFSQAEKTAEARIDSLRLKILEEFSKSTSDAKSEAFLDPDYQFVVRGAQTSFARSGDEWLKGELVRLLAVRSMQDSGSRKAMILNEAIGIAGNLTREEYAGLAVCFIIKQTKVSGRVLSAVFATLERYLSKFVDDLPDDNHAYQYLEAMRCVSINQISSVDLWIMIRENYRMELNRGMSINDVNAVLGPDGGVRNISLIVSLGGDRIRFVADSRVDLGEKLLAAGYSQETTDKLLALHDAESMDDDQIKEFVRLNVPSIVKVEKVWSTTEIQNCNHTALGKALAHSALVSRADFDGPLETWVK